MNASIPDALRKSSINQFSCQLKKSFPTSFGSHDLVASSLLKNIKFIFPRFPDYRLIESDDNNHLIAIYQNLQDPNQKIIFTIAPWSKEQDARRINYLETFYSKQNKSQNNIINQILVQNIGPIMVLSHKYYSQANNHFSVISDFSYRGRIFNLEITNQRLQDNSTLNSQNFANQSIKIIKDFIELNQSTRSSNPSPFKQNIN